MTAPYAIDSLGTVTQTKIDMLRKITGAFPTVWGRYLDGVTDTEVLLLKSSGIKLLPISRRSNQVTGNEAQGRAAAEQDSVRLQRLCEQPNVLRHVFLDVEYRPVLCADFWRGWANATAEAGFKPCVYLPNFKNWPSSWRTLQGAMLAGAPCVGTWVAWYTQKDDGSAEFHPDLWDAGKAECPLKLAPALLWQDTGNAYAKQFDFSIFNPSIEPWWS